MRQYTFAYGLVLLLMLGAIGWAAIQWALLKALKFRNERLALKRMRAWAKEANKNTWTDKK